MSIISLSAWVVVGPVLGIPTLITEGERATFVPLLSCGLILPCLPLHLPLPPRPGQWRLQPVALSGATETAAWRRRPNLASSRHVHLTGRLHHAGVHTMPESLTLRASLQPYSSSLTSCSPCRLPVSYCQPLLSYTGRSSVSRRRRVAPSCFSVAHPTRCSLTLRSSASSSSLRRTYLRPPASPAPLVGPG